MGTTDEQTAVSLDSAQHAWLKTMGVLLDAGVPDVVTSDAKSQPVNVGGDGQTGGSEQLIPPVKQFSGSADNESTYRANLSGIAARLQQALNDKPPDAAAAEIHAKLKFVHDLMKDAESKGDFRAANEYSEELLGHLTDYEKARADSQKRAANRQAAAKIDYEAKRYGKGASPGFEDKLQKTVNETPNAATNEIHAKLKTAYSQLQAAEQKGDYLAAIKHFDELGPLLANYEKARGAHPAQPAKAPEKPPASPGGGGQGTGRSPAKIGQEIDLATKEFSKETNYGVIKIAGTIKTAPTYIGAGTGPSPTPVGGNVTQTSRIKEKPKEIDKPKEKYRQGGVKQGFSFQQIADREFWVLTFSNLQVGVEGEWSGSEISAYGQIKFDLDTPIFTTGVEIRPILFKAKDGESPKILAAEIKIKKTAFTANIAGIDTPLVFEGKGSFEWDKKKVGVEVIEKVAKKRLESEAKKQGGKFVAKRIASGILTKLAAVAAAFEAGWVLGKLLNQFTASDEVAEVVLDDILGDLNQQWQKADTLGKMLLIVKNKERIVVALVAAGVTGLVAGIGDLVLFKLLKLDQLAADFAKALKLFMRIMESIPNLGDAMGDMILSTAIKLGIKFNPKYRTISNPDLETLALGVYALIKPVYKKKGGLNELISLKLYDVDVDSAVLARIGDLIQSKQLKDGGKQLKSLHDFVEFSMQDFLRFLETNHFITYKIKLDDNLSMSSITESMVNEVFL